MTLEVVEVTPMRRVVLEHETGRLELQIVRGGLSLQHRAAFDDDQALGTESSWRIALAMLGEYLDHHAGSTRRVHWAMTRGRADAALCHAYFTEPELLASWLGPVEGVGTTGSIVRFRFPGNRPASGVVLANTPGRDVAFSWREADQSVLVLRTLPLPAEPGARLALLGWSRWNDPPNARAVCQELDTAAERLGRWLERVACA